MKHLLNFNLLLVIVLAVSSCNKDKDKDKPEVKGGVVINGVRWATSNVDMPGTFAATPEDAGMFYQWNRKVGWSSTDPLIHSDGGTVWDDSTPTGDTWDPENDPCPCGWRVPTAEEFRKLMLEKGYWGELNGVKGYYFGSGETKMFLPVAGYRHHINGAIINAYMVGYYWSSSVISTGASFSLLYLLDEVSLANASRNPNGLSIRCVAIE